MIALREFRLPSHKGGATEFDLELVLIALITKYRSRSVTEAARSELAPTPFDILPALNDRVSKEIQ